MLEAWRPGVAESLRWLLLVILCLGAVVIPVWSARVQSRFFLAYRAVHGSQPRERPWFRLGEGLDDDLVGTWDFLPAWRVLSQPLDEPGLDQDRRRAQRAAMIEVLTLVVGNSVGTVLALILTRNLALGILPPILFMAGQLWNSSGALWLSRPELEDRQRLGGLAYRTTILVVAVPLLIVFALVGAVLLASGRV